MSDATPQPELPTPEAHTAESADLELSETLIPELVRLPDDTLEGTHAQGGPLADTPD